MKGKIQERWADSKYKSKNTNDNQELDISITDINLIDDTFLTKKQELIISLDMEMLNFDIIHEIYNTLIPDNETIGKQFITFYLKNKEDGITYTLKSHKKILITNELIDTLEYFKTVYNIDFKLN